jgi:hypothetical protein
MNIHPAPNVPEADFATFTADVGIFLQFFPLELLARWMGRDAGNLSKKQNGKKAITRKDVIDFYRTIGSVLIKLKSGVPAYQIELEMIPDEELTDAQKKNLWEEIRLIKQKLDELGSTLKIIQSR